MGHKINPKGFRLGTVFTWDSRWFASKKNYPALLLEDSRIRKALLKRLSNAGVVKVTIERSINKISLVIHVVRPGMVIGRGGQGMEELKKFTQEILFSHGGNLDHKDNKNGIKLDIRIESVKEPYLSAYFVANQIAEQLAKRMPHKRAVNFAMDKVMGSRAKGVKIILSGRIAGAEISRRETFKKGSIPLSTIREEIDYAMIPSLTKSGYIGVKVWICK